MKKNGLKKKLTLRARMFIAFWALLLCSFAVAISLQMASFNKLGAEEDRIRALIEDEDTRTAKLKNDMDYYESDAFVEKIAREQLDLIRQDEYLFYIDERN